VLGAHLKLRLFGRQHLRSGSVIETPAGEEATLLLDLVNMVRKRHVVYVEGFDRRGADGYYDLFQRACDCFQQQWPISLTVGPLELDSEDFAHWLIALRTATWQVATRYDFLRLDKFVQSESALPMRCHIVRSLRWAVDDFVSGAQFRIFRASWRFSLHLMYFQLFLLTWLGLPVMIGFVMHQVHFPAMAILAVSAVAALAAISLLRLIADRFFVTQVISCWAALRAFAGGHATWLDQAIEGCAGRIVAIAGAKDTEEIVVVGHSCGAAIASAAMARALDLDPDLGRRAARLTLLTLGSIIPGVALHPKAQRMRTIVGRLGVEPTLTWIDCQARKDVLSFSNFNPVQSLGLDLEGQQCNPLIWPVLLEKMVSPAHYRRLRWNWFRLHCQYLMAADRRAAYDYVLLVGGPVAVAEWAKHPVELTRALHVQLLRRRQSLGMDA
jgi:hypothetical protein